MLKLKPAITVLFLIAVDRKVFTLELDLYVKENWNFGKNVAFYIKIR